MQCSPNVFANDASYARHRALSLPSTVQNWCHPMWFMIIIVTNSVLSFWCGRATATKRRKMEYDRSHAAQSALKPEMKIIYFLFESLIIFVVNEARLNWRHSRQLVDCIAKCIRQFRHNASHLSDSIGKNENAVRVHSIDKSWRTDNAKCGWLYCTNASHVTTILVYCITVGRHLQRELWRSRDTMYWRIVSLSCTQSVCICS